MIKDKKLLIFNFIGEILDLMYIWVTGMPNFNIVSTLQVIFFYFFCCLLYKNI